MKEHPIIFTGPMVRAILEGRKTQTRRVIKLKVYPGVNPDFSGLHAVQEGGGWRLYGSEPASEVFKPSYQPGDRLWVREAFRLRLDQDHKPPSQDWWKSGAWYAADGSFPTGCQGGPGKLRSPIHMPRWASRLTLEVLSVRVERVQDISYEDAIAESCTLDVVKREGHNWRTVMLPTEEFQHLWNNIYGPDAWERNDWVWVYQFKKVEEKQ